jgi:hypothetical protein
MHNLITATHHIDKFDETSVMMLLSFQAKKEAKYREVHHGDHFDQKSVALRNCVYPLQGQIDRAQLVGVRKRASHSTLLVLRKLRSRVRDIRPPAL